MITVTFGETGLHLCSCTYSMLLYTCFCVAGFAHIVSENSTVQSVSGPVSHTAVTELLVQCCLVLDCLSFCLELSAALSLF